MSTAKAVLMVVVFLVILVMVILACGNPNRNDCMGTLHRALTVRMPAVFRQALAATGLTFLLSWGSKTYAFFFLQRNPFIMVCGRAAPRVSP